MSMLQVTKQLSIPLLDLITIQEDKNVVRIGCALLDKGVIGVKEEDEPIAIRDDNPSNRRARVPRW